MVTGQNPEKVLSDRQGNLGFLGLRGAFEMYEGYTYHKNLLQLGNGKCLDAEERHKSTGFKLVSEGLG